MAIKASKGSEPTYSVLYMSKRYGGAGRSLSSYFPRMQSICSRNGISAILFDYRRGAKSDSVACAGLKRRNKIMGKKAVTRQFIPGVGVRCRSADNKFAKCSTLSGSGNLSGRKRKRKKRKTVKSGIRRIRTKIGIRCVKKGKQGFVKCPKRRRKRSR